MSHSASRNITAEDLCFRQLEQPAQIADAWQGLSDAFDPPLDRTVPDLPAYARKLAENAVTIACYSPQNELLGCISFYANDAHSQEAYIAEFATSQRFRHLGIGKALIGKAYEASRSRGMQAIRLEVRKNNATAQRFYARQGFLPDEEGATTVFLRKELVD